MGCKRKKGPTKEKNGLHQSGQGRCLPKKTPRCGNQELHVARKKRLPCNFAYHGENAVYGREIQRRGAQKGTRGRDESELPAEAWRQNLRGGYTRRWERPAYPEKTKRKQKGVKEKGHQPPTLKKPERHQWGQEGVGGKSTGVGGGQAGKRAGKTGGGREGPYVLGKPWQ